MVANGLNTRDNSDLLGLAKKIDRWIEWLGKETALNILCCKKYFQFEEGNNLSHKVLRTVGMIISGGSANAAYVKL